MNARTSEGDSDVALAPRVEHIGGGQVQIGADLQEMSKEGKLVLLAEEIARFRPEAHRAKPLARTAPPAVVEPWPHNEAVGNERIGDLDYSQLGP